MTAYRPSTQGGYNLGEVASALQKCVRRGDEDGALFWGMELFVSGYGEYAWKRLRVMVSEDVGLGEPMLPAVVGALYQTFNEIAKKKDPKQSEKLQLAHAILLIVRAKKSRLVDHAAIVYAAKVRAERREIPDVALDKHTLRGKQKGRGFDHFFDEGAHLENRAGIPDPYEEECRAYFRNGGSIGAINGDPGTLPMFPEATSSESPDPEE